MADWFKCYEDELDKEEFQAAWAECQSLPSILLWVRCQATKAKSDRFEISNKYLLIGLAQKLKITEHELQRGFRLLSEIGYIVLEGAEVIILDWQKHQSKYLYEKQRKAKRLEKCQDVPTLNPQSNHIVPTLSPQSTLRGEEKRIDKKRIDKREENFPAPLVFLYEEIEKLYAEYGIKLYKKEESIKQLNLILNKHSAEHVLIIVSKVLAKQDNPKLLTNFGLLNLLERFEDYKHLEQQTSLFKPEPVQELTAEEKAKIDQIRAKTRELLKSKSL